MMASDKDQDAWMDSMCDGLELVPMQRGDECVHPLKKVDHPSWGSIAEFLRAPKAAKYPKPEDFAENRFGPL